MKRIRTRVPGAVQGAVLCYEPQPCTACDGSGRQIVTEYDGPVIRQSSAPCPACGGLGKR